MGPPCRTNSCGHVTWPFWNCIASRISHRCAPGQSKKKWYDNICRVTITSYYSTESLIAFPPNKMTFNNLGKSQSFTSLIIWFIMNSTYVAIFSPMHNPLTVNYPPRWSSNLNHILHNWNFAAPMSTPSPQRIPCHPIYWDFLECWYSSSELWTSGLILVLTYTVGLISGLQLFKMTHTPCDGLD